MTRVADLCLIMLAGRVGAVLYFDDAPAADRSSYQLIAMLAAVIFVYVMNHSHGYSVDRLSRLGWQAGRIALGWCFTVATLTAVAFFTKAGAAYSRGWAVVWLGLAVGLLALFRLTLFALIRRWRRGGQLSRVIAVIGAGNAAERLITRLEADGGSSGGHPVIAGVFDDRGTRIPASVKGRRVDGTVDRLIAYAQTSPIDEVIIALPLHAGKRIGGIIEKLRALPADVRLSLDPASLGFPVRGISQSGSVPVLEIFDRPLQHWIGLAKWLEDKVLSFTLLVLLAPLMLLIAVSIRLESPGRILFRQRRLGFNNRRFEILKFRTMYTHLCDADAKLSVTESDPRVTPIGRLLRRTSLDELPQLVNVLRGDMSLVGPRPHALLSKAADKLFHDAVANYAARHRVKPGITGWAQVNGWRGETDTIAKLQSRVEHDLYYIDNWSLALDLRIIVLTIFHLFRPTNAY